MSNFKDFDIVPRPTMAIISSGSWSDSSTSGAIALDGDGCYELYITNLVSTTLGPGWIELQVSIDGGGSWDIGSYSYGQELVYVQTVRSAGYSYNQTGFRTNSMVGYSTNDAHSAVVTLMVKDTTMAYVSRGTGGHPSNYNFNSHEVAVGRKSFASAPTDIRIVRGYGYNCSGEWVLSK